MLRRMRNARAVLFAFENDQIASGQLTFLTAMDLGVPVIVTQTQGLTDDYLTDGVTGLVVPKEEAALHEAMDRLAADPAFAALLSANAEQAFRTRFTYYHAGKEVGAQVSESEVV